MKYHPDKNPDKKNAETQFREIVEGKPIVFESFLNGAKNSTIFL